MPSCPDDSQPLSDAGDALRCGRCGGELVTAAALAERAAAAADSLALETDLESGAFVRTRLCPLCAAPMAPWRLGQADAWLERCNACEAFWLDQQDVRTVAAQAQRRVRAQVVATLSTQERRELTSALAEAARSEVPDELSATHTVLAALGLPVVTGTRAHRAPLASWALVLALLAVQVASVATEGGLAGTFGFVTGGSGALAAFTAVFVHAGWGHLLGNAWFLSTFGDGAEQRLPRWALVASFCALGAATTAVQAAFTGDGVLLLGASGGVSVVMGACIVLQPTAKVAIALPGGFRAGLVFRVPLWLFGVFELLWQALGAASGIPGIGWAAHLSGLVMGLGVGAMARMTASARAAAAP